MIDRQFQGFGDVPIAASTFGNPDDPPLLLLPGGGQSRRVWDDAGRALAAAGRYAVSIDLRSHGESGRPGDRRYDLDAHVRDLSAILAQFSSRPVVVGASLGGWIAMATLGEGEPDLATGLVLVDAPPQIDAKAARALGEALRRSEPMGVSDAFDPLAFADMDLENIERRLSAAAARIRQPTLIVRGQNSTLSTPEAIAALAGSMADAEHAEVEGAGHLAVSDQSEAFNALLLEFLERRVPREPPEYRQGSDSRTLRDALGCFGTGVTVVTTIDENGGPVGLTANSFTSVSLDPELLLVCLAKSAGSLPAFQAADSFAVNVLHIGQQPVSNRFASRGADKFADTDVETWEGGVPILKGSLASFECDKFAMHDGGDHEILIGRVRRVRYEPQRDPLLYFRGKYRRLHFA
ncbi:alpha/beta fold hydrolase [Novosphingopyxis sp.]|uniref:alpha/beta fold hydrolase n=1 Tax=Novosphingopyxis sp. TaxID=2709690 RepID=UPI003B5B0A02